MIEDLGNWIAEIPFDVFVAHLLPNIPGFDPSATVEALKSAGTLTCKQDSDIWSWSAFQSEPKQSEDRESVAFRPLETVHGQICEKALFPGETPQPISSAEFFVCGESTLTSGADVNRTPTSRPDGYRYLKRYVEEYFDFGERAHLAHQDKDDWYNVVHVEEYKKGTSLKDQDDVRKCI